MTQADIFVRKIAAQLKNVEQVLRTHPYVQAFRDGSASPEALVPFVGHQYHLLNADSGAAARLLARLDGELAGDVVRGFLRGGSASPARIPVMAASLGLSEADLRAYEPSAQGFAFGAYISLLFSQGTAAEVMCGLLVNKPAWGRNCEVIGRALRETYGWPKEATAFLDGYAAIPPFDQEALPVIQAGLDRGEDPRRIARVARLIQGYEAMFWDAVAAEAGHSLTSNRAARRLST